MLRQLPPHRISHHIYLYCTSKRRCRHRTCIDKPRPYWMITHWNATKEMFVPLPRQHRNVSTKTWCPSVAHFSTFRSMWSNFGILFLAVDRYAKRKVKNRIWEEWTGIGCQHHCRVWTQVLSSRLVFGLTALPTRVNFMNPILPVMFG